MEQPMMATDTPVAPDTQNAVPTTEQASKPLTDAELIAQDLERGTPPDSEREGKEEPSAKRDGTDTSEEDSEHPDAERMMRQDYLRRLDKLNKEKEALAKEREALEAEKARLAQSRALDTTSEVDDFDLYADVSGGDQVAQQSHLPPPIREFMENPVQDLDPDDWSEYESDYALASYVKAVGDKVHQMSQVMLSVLAEVAQHRVREQAVYADYAVTVMDQGAAEVAKRFGVTPTPEEIGEAILEHGEAVLKRTGGKLNVEAAIECWKRANVDLLLESVASKSEPKKPSVPQLNGAPSARGRSAPMTDDERIIEDLLRGA